MKQGRFRIAPQVEMNFSGELAIDNFAGGGGASTGIEEALGRPVDIAINHDQVAISMHTVNHPHTRHLCESVWDVDPVELCAGRPVGVAWFSPDCTHHSKARGGKPRDKSIRGLAWVALRWAARVPLRELYLENVEEFLTWGPLDDAGQPIKERKGETFRAFVSALSTGLSPKHPAWPECVRALGIEFDVRAKLKLFKGLGYDVDHRELRACDYGAPTIRKRLFLIARRDGLPIVWPEPTHGDPKSPEVKVGKLRPWRTAAECIDWSIPCPSIFERKKPLAEATLRRIAKGIMRYVVESPEPFIVSYYGEKKGEKGRGQKLREPLRTQTTENRFALVTPKMIQSGYGGRHPLFQCKHCDEGFDIEPTCGCTACGAEDDLIRIAEQKHDFVSSFLAKHYTGAIGSDLKDPAGTVTSIDHHSLVAATITKFQQNSIGQDPGQPLHTVMSGAPRFGIVAANLIRSFGESVGSHPEQPVGTITAGGMGKTGIVAANLVRNFGRSAGADPNEPACTITGKSKDSLITSHLVKLRGTCQDGQPVNEPMPTVTAGGLHVGEVRSFLLKYYGTDQDPNLREPMHTVTTKDRFGLVTVRGVEYQIVDIGMRMLSPRELFRAQGFPDNYIIDRDAEGKPITKTEQVAKCGNSVCPPIAAALIRANRHSGAAVQEGAAA